MNDPNDELENGGPGADTTGGEAGQDTAAGAAGADTAAGAAGTDTTAGAQGADTVAGAAGADKAPAAAGKAGKGGKAAKEPAPVAAAPVKKLSAGERKVAEILDAPDGAAVQLRAARGTIGDAREPHIVYRSTEHITRRVGDLRANSWLRAQIAAGVIEATPG